VNGAYRNQGIGRFIAGGILILLGLVYALDSFGVLYAGDIFRYWPVILIGIGVTRILQARLPGHRVVGFVMIVLLGLELVTGNFALLPLGVREGKMTLGALLANWGWVFLGNLIGSVFYALLFTLTLAPDSEMAKQLIAVSEAKTLGYAKLGGHGLAVVLSKAILCNWMVTLGVAMAMTSQSTIGKIAAMWLPIVTFFAQGFEHSVVNMFVIPAGMLLGAHVSAADWWLWNQLPVTLGNIVGGFIFTGLALHLTHRKTALRSAAPALAGEVRGVLSGRS